MTNVGRWLVVLAVALTGCSSLRLGPYTSPRVTGRVLAAGSFAPLAGVEVRRDARSRRNGGAGTPKGGELLLERAGAHTDKNGRCALPSERALTIFRPSGWNLVQLAFRRAGYESFQTNYSILSAITNAPDGEPVLNAGDILLRPAGARR